MKAVIKKLCENCSLPFKKNKASDEFNYSKALPAFLDAFRFFIHSIACELIDNSKQTGACDSKVA